MLSGSYCYYDKIYHELRLISGKGETRMKKRLLIVLTALVLVFTLASPATAASNVAPPCPAGFELHQIGDHMEHPDHHIGVTEDLNGNGYLCMRPLGNGLHVHVDDVIP